VLGVWSKECGFSPHIDSVWYTCRREAILRSRADNNFVIVLSAFLSPSRGWQKCQCFDTLTLGPHIDAIRRAGGRLGTEFC